MATTHLRDSTQEAAQADCHVAKVCAWGSGFSEDKTNGDTAMKRTTFLKWICAYLKKIEATVKNYEAFMAILEEEGETSILYEYKVHRNRAKFWAKLVKQEIELIKASKEVTK